MKPSSPKNRTIYFDYLRVFAMLAVMVLHISGQNCYNSDVNGLSWPTFNFYNSIVRWGVPVFTMISGALFLGRDIPLKKIYSKYILRLAVAFFIWSAIYAVFETGSLSTRIIDALKGHFHMWFIPMIIGLYMCIPLIRPIIKDIKLTRYFLVLAFVMAFCAPTLINLINDFLPSGIANISTVISAWSGNLNMNFVLGFTSFFILGYYLNTRDQSPKTRQIIYILGLVGFILTIALNQLVSMKTHHVCYTYFNTFTVNVFFEALAVFTWFKYHFLGNGKVEKGEKKEDIEKLENINNLENIENKEKENSDNNRINSFMRILSKYSFGAYLVHALIIDALDKLMGLNTLTFNPILSVIVITVIVAIVSFAISALLNQIPIIKKYAV